MQARKIIISAVIMFIHTAMYAQVKLGDNPSSINARSLLELESTSKGVLFPRMNSTQMNAISAPPAGLVIYNNDSSCLCNYNGTAWISLCRTGNAGTDNQALSISSGKGTLLLQRGGYVLLADSVIGNEVSDTITNGFLNKTGAGTAASPYKLGLKNGTLNGDVIQWNGSRWVSKKITQWIDTQNTNGLRSVVPGANNMAAGTYSFALGSNDTALGSYSVALGRNTKAGGMSALSTGWYTRASGNYSMATGFFNTASAIYSTAMGANSTASGTTAIAIGGNALASNTRAISIGNYSIASGNISTAMGYYDTASGSYSFAAGKSSRASAYGSIAIGDSCKATGQVAFAGGFNTKAIGKYSTAFGSNTVASGYTYTFNFSEDSPGEGGGATALGDYTLASAGASTAMGRSTEASADYSTAMGLYSLASGPVSIAMGGFTEASGNYSMAAGVYTTASGDASTAMGSSTTASGAASVSMGSYTDASGDFSIAIGINSRASGAISAATGYNTLASGDYSTAIGNNDTASGIISLATGYKTKASGNYSTAMGTRVSTNGQAGSFYIGDNSGTTTHTNNTTNQFKARFANGYILYSNAAASVGVSLAAGGNSWATVSDKNKKENFLPVSGEAVLKKISLMPLSSWNYKVQDKNIRHYGPMAQDFFAAFGKDAIGTIGCDTLITSADFDGINLIAIQALEKRTSDLQAQNELLKDQNAMLLRRLEALEQKETAQR